MIKFQGTTNGQQYTDLEEFQKALRQFTNSSSMHVQYSFEEVNETTTPEKEIPEDDSNNQPKEIEVQSNRAQQIEDQMTPEERDKVCSAIDVLKALVESASENIQVSVDSDQLNYTSIREFSQILDATMNKIRWTINRLPAELRFLLCYSLHDATEKMVENINSELVDRSYEEAKEQANITEQRQDLEDEIREIDNEIAELENEKKEILEEYEQLDKEYSHTENRIEAIKTASKFYEDLLEAFTY